MSVVDREGRRTNLSTGWESLWGLAWSPRGDEVWFTGARSGGSRSLYAVSLSGRLRLLHNGTGELALQDVARDGRALLLDDPHRLEIIGFSGRETAAHDLTFLDYSAARDLSADGKLLLFDESGDGGGPKGSVYVRSTDGSAPIRLGNGSGIAFSPDGRSVLAAHVGDERHLGLYPTGVGQPRILSELPGDIQWPDWLPNGKGILVPATEAGHRARLYVQDVETGGVRAVSGEGVTLLLYSHVITPDSRSVAARGPDGKIHLYPLDGGPPTDIQGLEAGEDPIRWSADGRALFLYRPGELPARIFRMDLASGRRELWRTLLPPDPAGVVSIRPPLMTPDGNVRPHRHPRPPPPPLPVEAEMTIAAGTRLGPYEVLSPIGAGGMGEVYRARDARLSREVAIKVLPASFSNDADRLRRFEQEAKAAGLLNHPNITAVYDIGTHEGAPYVVSELLEGETLRAALAGGRLSPRKAIDYALQMAHGLAAAHEKGIVHRDLKPENLFVTKDGRLKILDFGLAKLTRSEEGGSQQTNLPTAAAGTEPGVVLGTIGYMAPEQVRGRPADVRSDIFSFGAILYEMLSGTRAFHGDSAADTMSAILREDPPELSLTNQNLPPGLERIVRHCLEKNPEQRFQSARDLAFDLESLSGLRRPARGPPWRRPSVRDAGAWPRPARRSSSRPSPRLTSRGAARSEARRRPAPPSRS